MNIQATTTSITSSVSSINPTHLSTPTSQELAKTENGDSLTISSQGLDMFKQTQTASQAALEAVNDVESKDDSATLKTVLEGASSTEDDEASTTTDLSSLSDAQLAQKVADGTITQAEADAELAARKSKSEGSSEGNGASQTPVATNDEATMNMALSIDVMI